ncbi:hypothetical protein HU200_024803 [Digitaria exilis]|uniref:Uncharacterized protein n=1 Tax=Digitaria exilis TaxID=1010633 RepID=A0A835BZ51_9POAL|nr:hypothetical protein HU200_024803 [Digitaria exilis]
MGKKRASAVSAAGAPVFPFPADAAAGDPDHFSDYGFDPQLVGFFAQVDVHPSTILSRLLQFCKMFDARCGFLSVTLSQPEPKRPSWSKRRHQPPPPLESARFKLQKPISKRPQHQQKQQQQRRRRWWSSAASAALLLFKRPCSCSSSSSSPAVAPAPPPSAPSASVVMPMYLADDDDGGEAACACWAPAMRSGRLAAAELGASAALVPYVSLRSASLHAGGADGGAPAVPMYLVT